MNVSREVRNYFKLELLVGRSYDILRNLFKNRYSLLNNGNTWVNSSECGNNYLLDVIKKNKKINLTPLQKSSISSGNIEEWDAATLITLLLSIDRSQIQSISHIEQFDLEDAFLKQLRDIRNKLAHNANKSFNDVEFNQLWTDLTAILVALGDTETEINRLQDDSIFERPKQPVNERNENEALRLNSLGTAAHKDGNYAEAIAFFTQAIDLSDISDKVRATIYSNRAGSRLSLHEQKSTSSDFFDIIDPTGDPYLALQDAKQARKLCLTWWKGHFRIGQVCAALNEHTKALKSFERALAIDPIKPAIWQAMDKSRIAVHREIQTEYLDSKLNSRTFAEILDEVHKKYGVDRKERRKGYTLYDKIDPATADILKAHQYELGDLGVKQDYRKAAEYFAKAAEKGNAEGMFHLARLTDRGLGVKEDHDAARKLLEKAAAQPPQDPLCPELPNLGVLNAEYALGLRYVEGISVDKNPLMAFYWYQRASEHGSALATKNLGSMYMNGIGVDKDLEKAEEYFELASKRGNSLSMMNLAELLLIKDNFRMAKLWYDRACEAGNILAQNKRDHFLNRLDERQYPSNASENINNAVEKVLNSTQFKYSVLEPSGLEQLYLRSYSMLRERAELGSVTARIMCNALQHFCHALTLLLENDTLTEEQENIFVHELSQCYRIEQIVAQIPSPMHPRVHDIIDRVLRRCCEDGNCTISELDEDVRVCYATLNFSAYEFIAEFVNACKKKYPKSAYFWLSSAAANGFLREPQAGLHDINEALEIEPDNVELLYHRAVLSRHLKTDMDQAIKAYKKFLEVAPKDHRKVPEVYYEMAICYFIQNESDAGRMTSVRELYEQGKQAEKSQLPCFLPYKSGNLKILDAYLTMESLEHTKPTPVNNRKSRLTDPHRITTIQCHRRWESTTVHSDTYRYYTILSTSYEPRAKQETPRSLVGLKLITLRKMNLAKDHVYDGYVLSVTIIEQAFSWDPSIHLVIEDKNFDCERMLIYNFPKKEAEYLINEVYTVGSKMHIINPYLRIGTGDGKPSIRVDDMSSIVMQDESERIPKMCRYCGKGNAPYVCSICKQSRYCSRECQTNDWKLYKHKLICKSKSKA